MTAKKFGLVEVRVEDGEVDVGVGVPSGYHLEGPEILETTKEKAVEFIDGLMNELAQARAFLSGSARDPKDYAVELDVATRRIAGLEREVDRLAGWLDKIDGGDDPCQDESKLRQWAYQAITLGRGPEDAE